MHMDRTSDGFGWWSVHCVQHWCLAGVKLLITGRNIKWKNKRKKVDVGVLK